MVTAYGRKEIAQQAKLLGLDAFLVKPVSYSILLDNIIETFCQNRLQYSDSGSSITGAAVLKGRKVLVVEDNEINQQVARELLEGFGLTVEIAGNGKVAVELVTHDNRSYDAVLMDLQMPEMDGYQATDIIRSKFRKDQLPVIAMTAHALQSEIQRCMGIGMNDCVTKPVDPEKLQASLVQWIKPVSALQLGETGDSKLLQKSLPSHAMTNTVVGASLDTVFPETVKEEPPLNIPGIDLESVLKRLGGNVKLFNKLVNDFASNNANAVKEIRRAIDSGDLAVAQSLTHTLKGVAGNLSAMEVFLTSKGLESAIRQAVTAQTILALEKLENALKPLIEAIKSSTSSPGLHNCEADNSAGLTIDTSAIKVLFQELDGRLIKNSLSARKVFDSLKAQLPLEKSDEQIMQIENCLNCLDFKGARRQLALLAKNTGMDLGK